MKATGTYEQVIDVDPLALLTPHTREHIDHWVAKFPPDRKRSALIQALFATQEQNGGFLTDALIVADAAARVSAVDAVLLVWARGEAGDGADDHAR